MILSRSVTLEVRAWMHAFMYGEAFMTVLGPFNWACVKSHSQVTNNPFTKR